MRQATSPSSSPSDRRRGRWFAVGAIAVAAVAFIAITTGGIGQNLVYYWGPSEIHQAGEKAYGATIRLGGQVRPGSIVYQEGVGQLDFDVTDGRSHVHVKASSMPPQMFREGIGVVVEGTMTRDGHFASNRLMVSHDNEYRAPGEGEVVDTKDLMKTAEGVDGPS
jgi:cytochrome c-type biogenesis protein CcmE